MFRVPGVGALFLLALGAAALPLPAKECVPSFPPQGEWLGADAAYSIPISGGRVVWIFGDTLYGKERVVKGDVPRMVRNSVGVSTCDPEKGWSLEYTIRKGNDGTPLDFFESPSKAHWYWALDGFFHQDALYVSLLCVRDKAVEGSAALAFETCGADLAKVTNLSASPQDWKVEVFPLVPDGVKAYPSSTAVIHGDHAYIFAQYEKPPHPMLLTRIPLTGLATPRHSLEYLAQDGKWRAGLDPADARHVMVPGASEMSVRYHPELKQWVAIMIGQPFPSDKVWFRTAPELTGPWSEGKVIHTIAEMQPGSAGYDRDTFCYAAKEHPEFESPDQLLFTYVCNSFTVKKIVDIPTIYFPKVVVMPMPK
jgi:hypothetical protein